jgi:hypothetical protein
LISWMQYVNLTSLKFWECRARRLHVSKKLQKNLSKL